MADTVIWLTSPYPTMTPAAVLFLLPHGIPKEPAGSLPHPRCGHPYRPLLTVSSIVRPPTSPNSNPLFKDQL